MNKLLLPLLFLFALSVHGQTKTTYLSDFHLENQAIVHKKVYEPTDTANLKERLLTQLRSTRGVENVQDMGDYISADIKGMEIDYQKHGGKKMTTPIFLNHQLNAMLTVQLKEGRYRTLIEKINHVDHLSNVYAASIAQGKNITATEDYYLKRGGESFKNNRSLLGCLYYTDKYIEDTFTLKEVAASEDW